MQNRFYYVIIPMYTHIMNNNKSSFIFMGARFIDIILILSVGEQCILRNYYFFNIIINSFK